MARTLDTTTLDMAACAWAFHFALPTTYSKRNPEIAIAGREWALQSLYMADFKDEFEHLIEKFRAQLGPEPLADFERVVAKRYTPRSDEVFAELLAEKLAITPDGDHIPGMVGTVVVGNRNVGQRLTRHGKLNARWNIYAGEDEERVLGNVRTAGEDGPGTDPLPPEDTLWANETDHMGMPSVVMMALNTNVSIAFAQAALDPALDLLDEGSADGVLIGRDGAQPVDPNAAPAGTILFEMDLGTPGFAAAADGAPNAIATANAIADDTAANNTSTVTWVRVSSSNSVPTPLNDHIDGSAGISSGTFDFEFNTAAIVSGATVSMTWTFTIPQGPTAT